MNNTLHKSCKNKHYEKKQRVCKGTKIRHPLPILVSAVD